MKTRLTFALSIGLAAFAGLAFAQSSEQAKETSVPPPTDLPALHPADLNDDGHVTSEEFEQFHENLFDEADTNDDGRLDRDEVLALPKHLRGRQGQIPPAPGPEWRSGKRRKGRPNPEHIFTTFDANDDGRLQRDEVPEGLARHFDRIDADGDDGITLEEFRQAKPDRKEMRKRFEERFKSMDRNEDGKIQKDEATGRMSERFDRIDKNGDGAIDQDEIEALRSKFRRHMKGGEERPRRHRGSGDAADEPSPASEPAESPEM